MAIEKHDKYYSIDGNLDNGKLNAIIEFLNSNPIEKILFKLDSGGGDRDVSYFIQTIFNEHKERISLFAGTGIYSSAFYLFYGFKGQRIMVNGCRGMVHYAFRSIDINDNSKPVWDEGKCIIKSLPERKLSTEKYVSEFLTKAELKKFKKGEDVYFIFERMKEIFRDAIII